MECEKHIQNQKPTGLNPLSTTETLRRKIIYIIFSLRENMLNSNGTFSYILFRGPFWWVWSYGRARGVRVMQTIKKKDRTSVVSLEPQKSKQKQKLNQIAHFHINDTFLFFTAEREKKIIKINSPWTFDALQFHKQVERKKLVFLWASGLLTDIVIIKLNSISK